MHLTLFSFSCSVRMSLSRSTTAMSAASRVAQQIQDEEYEKTSNRTGTPHLLSADAENLLEQYVRPFSDR